MKIAQTARPVLPFPEVIQAKLTFAAVMQLFQELLNAPSGGAHQQFLTAALLHARLEQAAKLEQEGGKQRVETKNINASDLSTRSAADIQIKIGSRTIEAYEVTANDWSTKLEQAIPTMKTHDLSRLHILARVDDFPEMLIELKKLNEDVSAIDILAFIAVLTSDLRREFRLVALRRLYGLLDREQPNIDLVNQYVQKLYVHGLVNAPPA